VNNVIGGVKHTLGFTIFRRCVWAGHLEVYAMSKEELPRGRVVELTPIVALDALNLAPELSLTKEKNWVIGKKVSDFRRKGKVLEWCKKSSRMIR
jgi:hypothetical protein